MATESPNIRDTQNIAGANFSSTAGLAGFNGTGQYLLMKQSAAADRTLLLDVLATTEAYGVLQNDPALGAACDTVIFGITKAIAGAAITRGSLLMCDTSGRVITYTTPGTNYCVGVALESAVGVNNVITILFQLRGLQP